MRFGLVLPTLTGDVGKVMSLARDAEEAGIDGVFVPDHLGEPGRTLPLEAFTTLSAVAAETERIAVGTLVARASLRPVGMLAKLAASVDDLSGGRLILGLGAGDDASAREQEALGLPSLDVDERRRQLTETIGALRQLFAGSVWEGGVHVPPLSGPLLPAPVRTPPVWVGGASASLAATAASDADAWNGWGLDDSAFAERARVVSEGGAGITWGGIVALARTQEDLEALLARRAEAGLRPPHRAETVDGFLRWIEGLSAIGVSWVTIVMAGGHGGLELLSGEVLPRVGGDV